MPRASGRAPKTVAVRARAGAKSAGAPDSKIISDEAVTRATGRGWEEWYAILDAFTKAAGKADHTAAAAHIYDEHACPAWWSQMVTVGWERARGLREKHQRPDGYSISGSRMIAAPVSDVYQAWQLKRVAAWLPDAEKPPFTVRTAIANKSMRITWSDGKTNLEVMFYPKAASKCQVTIQHGKLPSAAAGKRMKAYWAGALDALRDSLQA